MFPKEFQFILPSSNNHAMQVQDVINVIEQFAPIVYQESYDNSGLQVGDASMEVSGVLLSLDITEAIVDDALARGCNMIVAHHPLLFSGLKKITGGDYVQRVVVKAIKNDIALYAAHTNLDNMRQGVSAKMAEKLSLKNTHILRSPKGTLLKLYTYAPIEAAKAVKDALLAAGAGAIGQYTECSFSTKGEGTFRASHAANPTIGVAGGARTQVEEQKIEVILPLHLQSNVLKALKEAHPYEEVAYELISLKNTHQDIGAGLVGELERPMEESYFMEWLKEKMQTNCIRHTALLHKPIQKIALCGGAGSFLLADAISAKADVFITGDYKYHQFFDADGKILIADIGHYESEQFTVELLSDIIKEKFPNFAVLLSKLSTNPVNYYC